MRDMSSLGSFWTLPFARLGRSCAASCHAFGTGVAWALCLSLPCFFFSLFLRSHRHVAVVFGKKKEKKKGGEKRRGDADFPLGIRQWRQERSRRKLTFTNATLFSPVHPSRFPSRLLSVFLVPNKASEKTLPAHLGNAKSKSLTNNT